MPDHVSNCIPARCQPLPQDRHAIYAYLDTGVKVRVSPSLTWDAACRVYHAQPHDFSNLHAVRGASYKVGEYRGTVKHFCVRSVSDPNWPAAQPPHELSTLEERLVDFFTTGTDSTLDSYNL